MPPSTYRLKKINFLGRVVPVILQNENGPCPLLAISNILLLRNQIHIHPDYSSVTHEHLLSLVGEYILEANKLDRLSEALRLNQQENIAAALSLLPKLALGLDVNVRFQDARDFEYTPECAIFDLLDISLLHGWLIDPEDAEISRIINSLSYNQVVEKIVSASCCSTPSRQGSDVLRVARQRSWDSASSAAAAHLHGPDVQTASLPAQAGDLPPSPPQFSADESPARPVPPNPPDSVAADAPLQTPPSVPAAPPEASPSADPAAVPSPPDVPQVPPDLPPAPHDTLLSPAAPPPPCDAPPGHESSVGATSPPASQRLRDIMAMEQWLTQTSSQLTYHGLIALHSVARERQLVVFFRNNHFATMFKLDGFLFVLLTDEGYALSPLVWERLEHVDGDNVFVTADFRPQSNPSLQPQQSAPRVSPQPLPASSSASSITSATAPRVPASSSFSRGNLPPDFLRPRGVPAVADSATEADYLYALQLEMEERHGAASMGPSNPPLYLHSSQQQHQQPPPQRAATPPQRSSTPPSQPAPRSSSSSPLPGAAAGRGGPTDRYRQQATNLAQMAKDREDRIHLNPSSASPAMSNARPTAPHPQYTVQVYPPAQQRPQAAQPPSKKKKDKDTCDVM